MADYYRPPKLLGTLEINRIPNDRPMASSQQMTDGAKNCSVAGVLWIILILFVRQMAELRRRLRKTLLSSFFLPTQQKIGGWWRQLCMRMPSGRKKPHTAQPRPARKPSSLLSCTNNLNHCLVWMHALFVPYLLLPPPSLCCRDAGYVPAVYSTEDPVHVIHQVSAAAPGNGLPSRFLFFEFLPNAAWIWITLIPPTEEAMVSN